MFKFVAVAAVAAATIVGHHAASATVLTPAVAGCADGTREGFTNVGTYPSIAACDAAWSIRGINLFAPLSGPPSCPGLPTRSTFAPACDRAAGNNGTNRAGTGCNVADVCAAGWEVCTSEAQVKNASSGASCSGVGPITGSKFWGTRQSSSGCGVCARGTVIGGSCNALSCANNCFQDQHLTNDVFGCGNVGGTPNCGSLTRFTHNLCSGLAGTSFNCNDPSPFDDNGACETYTFLNTNPNFGGVLCCKIGTSPDFDNDGIPDSQDNCPTVPNPTQANACNPATPQGDACEPCDANIPGAYQCGEDGSSCDHAIQSSATNTVGIYWTDVPNTGRPCDQ